MESNNFILASPRLSTRSAASLFTLDEKVSIAGLSQCPPCRPPDSKQIRY